LSSGIFVDIRCFTFMLNRIYFIALTGIGMILHLVVTVTMWAGSAEYEKGLALLKAGRAADALSHLESARRGQPDNPDILYTLGQTYFVLGRTADAASSLLELAHRHTSDPIVLTAAGSLLLAHSMPGPALEILTQAEGLDPNNPMLLSLLAKAQLGTGHAAASAGTLRHLLSSLKRTGATETQSAIQNAFETASALHVRNATSVSAGMLAAELAFLLNRFGDVVRILEPLRAAALRDPDYFNLLAASFAGVGDFAQATAAGKRALEIAPGRQDLILNLAGVYQKARNNQAAIRLLQTTVSKGVLSPEIYFALALSQFNFGSYSDAAVNCDRALAANPQFDRALLLKGRAYARMARREDATAAFRAALRMNTACDYCRYELAEQLAQTGQPAEAESLLREVVQRSPENAAAQYQLGKLLASRGETQQAIASLEAAVAADNNNESAWYQLGKLYSQTVETAKAKAAFAMVKQIKDQRRSAAESHMPKANR
jgi:tetratricopeptide (TPR) repeat protein